MKIVVLDGYTLNPGDLSWEGLRDLGEVTLYERSAPRDVGARIRDAEIVLTNKAIVSREAIEQASRLRYIGVTATGFNVVDIKAAGEKGIPVTNAAAYSTPSVAQHVFALLLELCNRTGQHDLSVKAGEWCRSEDFCYTLQSPVELSGKTLGIIGLGQIGQAVARIGISFGMQVLAHHKHPERDAMDGVRFGSFEDCLKQSDVLSLHCPLNDANKGFINRETLSLMKPGAFLINTSRGPLVNEQDLADALNWDGLAGAGLDVLSGEPPARDNPLLRAKNCVITPHIAWASKSARERLLGIVIDNIKAFQAGQPTNMVSGF